MKVDNHIEKKQIRKYIQGEKENYCKEELEKYSEIIFQKLESLPLFHEAHTVLLFHSLPDEVYTHNFINKHFPEKRIILPVVSGETLILKEFTGQENMKTGAYGIKEPFDQDFEDYSKIDLAIIPGVAFDRKGNRLGRGKGYYDRLLPLLKCPKIGICFSFQLLKDIPCELHDIPMHHVLTEKAEIPSLEQLSH